MIARADFEFTVSDEAFAYLAVQKGGLDKLRHDRAAWEAAYKVQVFETYESLVPFLPADCEAMLDVGGGMSGISALLNRHYGGGVTVAVLDGLCDPPVMRRHAETFNSLPVTERFLRAHGVRDFVPIPPAMSQARSPERFDLVVSFGAWCFHIAPPVYLPFVRAASHPGTVLILEVRNGRPDWQVQLERAFAPASAAHRAEKFTRRVYVPA